MKVNLSPSKKIFWPELMSIGLKTLDKVPSFSILLVEDDDELRLALCDALTQIGHRVRALDCAEALPEQPDLNHLDLSIIDINLPGEDGLSLLKRLRDIDADIGIIVLTARLGANEKAQAYEMGADLFIAKPTSLGELREAINALGRRLVQNHTDDSVLWVETSYMGLQVRFGDELLNLTNGEARLLAAWGRADQNMLTHAQIAELLDAAGPVKKSLIELHISRLRKKLSGCVSQGSAIRSVRSIGYQLCLPVKLVT